MPENFEIVYKFVFWLFPLPFLIYWIMPPLRLKSSSLLLPDFDKAQKYTGEKDDKTKEEKEEAARLAKEEEPPMMILPLESRMAIVMYRLHRKGKIPDWW